MHLDGSCYFPLTQGPCNEDRLVVAADEEGEGKCEEGCAADQLLFSNGTVEGECVSYDAIECGHRGERAYAALDGTFECDCDEGWGRVDGQGDCKQEGTMCGENRILLPVEQTSWCGDQCVHFESCSQFIREVDDMVDMYEDARSKYEAVLEHMKERICDREERKICCLSASSPLPRLGRAAQVLGCQENPCAGESDPSISWPNTKGCFRLPPYAISNPSDCYLFLNDTNELECDDEFGLRGVGSSAGSSKCKARQVWSAGRGKCIAKF